MGIRCKEINTILGVSVGQGAQKDRVDNAENGDGGTNSKRSHQEHNQREAGDGTKSAEFVFEIRRENGEMLIERR